MQKIILLNLDIHQKQREILSGFDSLLYFSVILFAIAAIVIIYKRLKQKSELNRIQTIKNEHSKFSRNLHDGLAQDLAAIKIYLQKDDKAKSGFYAERALEEARYLIDSMRLDFSLDLETLFRQTLQTFEINFEIKTTLLITSSKLFDLDAESKMEIFLILQEALSNIARHANASLVELKITDIGEKMQIIIKDNGKGFSEEEFKKNLGKKHLQSGEEHHWGLVNIHERVALLGGSVKFINDGGTTIAITI